MPTALTDQIKRAIEREYHRRSDGLISGAADGFPDYKYMVGYLGGLAEAMKIMIEETEKYLRTDDE